MTREEILMSNAKAAANYLSAQAAGALPTLASVPDKKPPKPLPVDDQIKDLLTKAQDPATSAKERYELLTKAKALRSQPDRWANVQFTPAGR
jgi:hypothetical protein